ncbi:MAG: hypothetical protein WC262_12565, partial [Bacteroidales bacterium]
NQSLFLRILIDTLRAHEQAVFYFPDSAHFTEHYFSPTQSSIPTRPAVRGHRRGCGHGDVKPIVAL